jgi:hypothetical protein
VLKKEIQVLFLGKQDSLLSFPVCMALEWQCIDVINPYVIRKSNKQFCSLLFDPVDQFVDVRPGTTHQFIAPTSTDKRGPCQGLNAAANHGFLPRNGIPTILQSK